MFCAVSDHAPSFTVLTETPGGARPRPADVSRRPGQHADAPVLRTRAPADHTLRPPPGTTAVSAGEQGSLHTSRPGNQGENKARFTPAVLAIRVRTRLASRQPSWQSG